MAENYTPSGKPNFNSTLASKDIRDEFDLIEQAFAGVESSIVQAAKVAEFGELTGLPTSLVGYGITDAYTKAEVDGIAEGKADANDERLSDSRTPIAHKSSHATGGGDALTPSDIGAATAEQGAKADTSVQLGSEWVDVRAYGASTESTDNSTAINAAIAAAAGKRVVVAGGVFKTTAPIAVVDGAHLEIAAGATIKAGTGFTGTAMITFTPGFIGYTQNWSVTGKGTIDGANIADGCIDVYQGRFAKIGDHLEVHGGRLFGIRLGDPAAAANSYEIDISRVRVNYNDVANLAGSIGIHHRRVTDSFVSETQVIGYRQGYKTESGCGAIDYKMNHAWVRPVHGPMTHGFINLGNNNVYILCYSDAPTNGGDGSITDVYGFYHDCFNFRMTECRVYNNTYVGKDSILTAVHSNKAASYSSIKDLYCFAETTGVKFKAYIGGVDTALEINTILNDGRAYTANSSSNYIGSVIHNGFETFNVSTAFKTSSGAQIKVDTAASGQNGDIEYKTNDSLRWRIRKASGAESGSNVGSPLQVERFSDTGVYIDAPLTIDRATGRVMYNYTSFYALKVAVPANATAPGQPGQWAADASYVYIYTGDGTTHAWRRAAIGTW